MTVISRFLLMRPPPVTSSRGGRAAAVGTLVAAAVIGTATSAVAHVGVFPDSTTAGQGAQLTFRVPDESQTASTIRLVVTLPQDRPFTDISTKPMPGWTTTVTDARLPKPVTVGGATITKAPRTVTWPAQAEPEHPVPAFTVTAPPATGVNSTSTPAAGVQASGTTPPAATTTDGTARVLGAAA